MCCIHLAEHNEPETHRVATVTCIYRKICSILAQLLANTNDCCDNHYYNLKTHCKPVNKRRTDDQPTDLQIEEIYRQIHKRTMEMLFEFKQKPTNK